MKIKKITIEIIMVIPIIILTQKPTLAELSCPAKSESSPLTIKEEWKKKFPFDMVYPVGNPDTDIDTRCPKVELFGIEREVCSIMMIATIAKSAFMGKLLIDLIKNI